MHIAIFMYPSYIIMPILSGAYKIVVKRPKAFPNSTDKSYVGSEDEH